MVCLHLPAAQTGLWKGHSPAQGPSGCLYPHKPLCLIHLGSDTASFLACVQRWLWRRKTNSKTLKAAHACACCNWKQQRTARFPHPGLGCYFSSFKSSHRLISNFKKTLLRTAEPRGNSSRTSTCAPRGSWLWGKHLRAPSLESGSQMSRSRGSREMIKHRSVITCRCLDAKIGHIRKGKLEQVNQY